MINGENAHGTLWTVPNIWSTSSKDYLWWLRAFFIPALTTVGFYRPPTTEPGLIIQAFPLSLIWWMSNASYSFYCKFLDTIAFEHSVMGGSHLAFPELLVIAFEHFPLGFISFPCQMVCCFYILSTLNLSLFYMLKIPSPSPSFAFNFIYVLSHWKFILRCDPIFFGYSFIS